MPPGVTLLPFRLDTIRLDKHHFTPSQKILADIVFDWARRPRKMVVTVSGGPGTGKTFGVIKTVECVLLGNDHQLLKMASTARSAQSIGGRTIHSTVQLDWSDNSLCRKLELQLEMEGDVEVSIETSRDIVKEFKCSSDPTIVVVDEVGMINGWLMYWLVRYFMDRTKNPLLCILMGDRHQLNPVRSKQNVFGISLDTLLPCCETRYVGLHESKRFEPDYEMLVNRLRECVDQANEKDLLDVLRSSFPVVECITDVHLDEATRAMAFLRMRAHEFNRYYIEHKMSGKLFRVLRIDSSAKQTIATQYLDLRANCLIFVTQNKFSEAPNGTELIFKWYDGEKDALVCEYPDTKKAVKVFRNMETGMFPVELGFAGTVHKFQGQTMNDSKIVISFDGKLDLHLVYTALSRVKSLKQILAIQL